MDNANGDVEGFVESAIGNENLLENAEANMPRSNKTVVVEKLFFDNWDAATQSLSRSLMNSDDVLAAIDYCNAQDGKKRSKNNPANFMKDIVRKSSASAMWPQRLTDLRYTAVQRTGELAVFEFIPFEEGQTEPFPDIYRYRDGVPEIRLQSLSMLHESKFLGRADESWITQTAVKLGVAESHFALSSPLAARVLDVIHLQMTMKLRSTEVDSFYMARLKGQTTQSVEICAITCEAKQHDERILENQIVEQAKAAFEQGRFAMVIPIAMRAVRGKGIYVVEFEPVDASNAPNYEQPVRVAEALYSLVPPVKGI